MSSGFRWFAAIPVLLLAFGASIAGAEEPLKPDDEAAATAEAGYGRVFGRAAVVEDGKERPISPWTEVFRVRIRSLATGQTQALRIDGDGSFVWPLKPGEYVIQSVYFRRTTARLWAVFSVPPPGRAAYIGDLRAILDRNRVGIAIADAYEEASKAAEARLTEAKSEPVKALMQREREPGSYARITWICSPEWGLQCDRNHQGVEAVLPEGASGGFPHVPTLTPLFAWKPSAAEGVAYDLAIYEAYMPESFVDGRRRERGRQVHYVEALREPRFQMEVPLPPGKSYLWSVRLRQGDTVSNWTTTSYAAFLLVVAVSGSGQWYGFETPGQ